MKSQTPITRCMPVSRASQLALVLSVGLVGCLHGCGKDKGTTDRIATFPVHGKLLINGAPAPGAMVKFFADKQAGRVPTAIVREDGSFSASYYDAEDGAPAGEYKLLVVWMLPPPEGGMAQDALGGRFLDPARPVATITVHPTENRLSPLELSAPTGTNLNIPK
jgi:hypothetical protein